MKNSAGTDKIYQMITQRFIDSLEKGVIPWKKEWKTSGGGRHRNYVSDKPYRGVNYLIVSMSPYECPFWASFKQISDAGGKIIKGQKSTPILYWNFVVLVKDGDKMVKVTKKNGTWFKPNGTPVSEDASLQKIPYMRYYNVWNLEQTEGIDWESKLPKVEETPDLVFKPIEEAQRIVDLWGEKVPITHDGGQRAYYKPLTDSIHLPLKEKFLSEEAYYSTTFHEMTHSTGHKDRLDRFKGGYFGDEEYSKEELVAEIGAAFLCSFCGISNTLENSEAYIKSWLKALKDDEKMIVFASQRAQKATDMIFKHADVETLGEAAA